MRSHAENSLQSQNTDAPKGLPTLNVVILYAPKMQQFSNNQIWTEIIRESSNALEPVIVCFVMCNWLHNKIHTTMLPLFAGINVRKQLLKRKGRLTTELRRNPLGNCRGEWFKFYLFFPFNPCEIWNVLSRAPIRNCLLCYSPLNLL